MIQEIAQPPLITARGEIDLHGRAGITLSIGREDADSQPIDVGDQVYLEIEGQLRKPLDADPNDDLGRLAILTDAECAALPFGQRLALLVIDNSADPGVVLFEGWVLTHGYTAAP